LIRTERRRKGDGSEERRAAKARKSGKCVASATKKN